jgi:hypothetical protein
MSWIPEDIGKRLRSDFGAAADLARRELEQLRGIASDAALPRIARCIVHLANRAGLAILGGARLTKAGCDP